MQKTCYQSIHEAISALEFFETAHASGPDFKERKSEIVAILKSRAVDKPPTPGSSLAMAIANAIEAIQ